MRKTHEDRIVSVRPGPEPGNAWPSVRGKPSNLEEGKRTPNDADNSGPLQLISIIGAPFLQLRASPQTWNDVGRGPEGLGEQL